jgi:hypothetical protein
VPTERTGGIATAVTIPRAVGAGAYLAGDFWHSFLQVRDDEAATLTENGGSLEPSVRTRSRR